MPTTCGRGEFVRQVDPQADEEGMILDVRWNRGGFTSQAVLAALRRTLAGGFVNREGAVSPLPVAVPPRAIVTYHHTPGLTFGLIDIV